MLPRSTESFMFDFRNLFDKSSRSERLPTSPRRKAPPRARLHVEHLADRKLLAVSLHGGPVIPHVQVENLYYGADWASSANQQNMHR